MKTICLCGSLRFKKEYAEQELRFALEGYLVLLPTYMWVDAQRSDQFLQYKPLFDEIHFRKIDLADEIFVINKDGYIGESTRNEINYAMKLNKPITYLEPL